MVSGLDPNLEVEAPPGMVWLSSGCRSFIMDAPQIECHDNWYYSLSVSCIQDIIPFACLVILFLVSIIVYWLPNDSLMLTAPVSCLSIMQESSQCRQQAGSSALCRFCCAGKLEENFQFVKCETPKLRQWHCNATKIEWWTLWVEEWQHGKTQETLFY